MDSKVYFLPWNMLDRLGEWLKAAGAYGHVRERDFTAVKIHFGEAKNRGYIRPELVRPAVDAVKERGAWPFLTDASTIYIGQRADAVHHLAVAAEHGFTLERCGCPVIIADGLRGNAGVDVEVNLKHFKSVSIANAVHYADSFLFFNHFKGHEISGFGGALKNIGMGCGTRAGKYAMHDRVAPSLAVEKCLGCGHCEQWCSAGALELREKTIAFLREKCVGCGECILSCPQNVFKIPWDENTGSVQEKIVEYAFGVLKGRRHFSVSFLNHVTKFCDCYATRGEPLLPDMGVLASADPVALDQASVDKANEAYGGDFCRAVFPDIDWQVQFAYAESLGLGSRKYQLVGPDEVFT